MSLDKETQDRLKAIETRLNNASPGPWEHEPGFNNVEAIEGGTVCWIQYHGNTRTILEKGEEYSHADGDFIASAPEDISFLLATIGSLTTESDGEG